MSDISDRNPDRLRLVLQKNTSELSWYSMRLNLKVGDSSLTLNTRCRISGVPCLLHHRAWATGEAGYGGLTILTLHCRWAGVEALGYCSGDGEAQYKHRISELAQGSPGLQRGLGVWFSGPQLSRHCWKPGGSENRVGAHGLDLVWD